MNISLCALSTATIDNILLFTNLLPECKPIATKSRSFSFDDEDFMQVEIYRFLSGGIIEPSTSPSHAQIVMKTVYNLPKSDYAYTILRQLI